MRGHAPVPPASRTPQLWGCGRAALFPERDGCPASIAVAPWPPRAGRRGHPSFDRRAVLDVLGRPPVLEEVDPRLLHASQPAVTFEGVDHYLGDSYRQTGTPYADRDRLDNQLPLIHRRADGRLIILGGHHRSAAALLTAQPVRALVVDDDHGRPPTHGAAAVTATLLLGTHTDLEATAVVDTDHGVAIILGGGTALTAEPSTAEAILGRLGALRSEAQLRLARAAFGVALRR